MDEDIGNLALEGYLKFEYDREYKEIEAVLQKMKAMEIDVFDERQRFVTMTSMMDCEMKPLNSHLFRPFSEEKILQVYRTFSMKLNELAKQLQQKYEQYLPIYENMKIIDDCLTSSYDKKKLEECISVAIKTLKILETLSSSDRENQKFFIRSVYQVIYKVVKEEGIYIPSKELFNYIMQKELHCGYIENLKGSNESDMPFFKEDLEAMQFSLIQKSKEKKSLESLICKNKKNGQVKKRNIQKLRLFYPLCGSLFLLVGVGAYKGLTFLRSDPLYPMITRTYDLNKGSQSEQETYEKEDDTYTTISMETPWMQANLNDSYYRVVTTYKIEDFVYEEQESIDEKDIEEICTEKKSTTEWKSTLFPKDEYEKLHITVKSIQKDLDKDTIYSPNTKPEYLPIDLYLILIIESPLFIIPAHIKEKIGLLKQELEMIQFILDTSDQSLASIQDYTRNIEQKIKEIWMEIATIEENQKKDSSLNAGEESAKVKTLCKKVQSILDRDFSN